MKKYLRLVLILLAVAVPIIYPTKTASAEDISIPTWKIEADLQDNGDLKIIEDITFDFNEKFNGVFRDIMLKGTSGVSEIKVQELKESTIEENVLIDYKLAPDADNGQEGVYTLKEDKNKMLIKIYAPSKNQVRTFRLSYTVKNVAVRYNDTGELYYKFVGDENDTPIGRLVILINLPKGMDDSRIKVFAHGPLNGTIEKVSSTSYRLMVAHVPSETFVEGRVLFPKELIPLSERIENIDNYSDILQEEEAYLTKLEQKQARKKVLGEFFEQASIYASGFGLLVFILCLFLFRRKDIPTDYQEYHTGIPEDCTPAVAALITGTFAGTNTIFATILDLMRKGYFEITGEKDPYYGEASKDIFIITLVKPIDNSLLQHEAFFIRWLIHELGNGKSVSSKDIEYYGKQNNSKFYIALTKWKKKVKSDATNKGYYDKGKGKISGFIIVLSILLFIIGIATAIFGSLYSLINFIAAGILLIYGIALAVRLSDYGYGQYRKWINFKKAIKKFKPDFTRKDIIDTLDTSLIYALGMNTVKKPEKGYKYTDYSIDSWAFWYFMFVSTDDNSFRKSFDYSFITGSDSTSGGGFSAGGGGGAGGGGAGGF